MKLISMVEFTLMPILDKLPRDIAVTNSKEGMAKAIDLDRLTNIKYARLLNTKLSLGLFIPCSKRDKPLTEPFNFKVWYLGMPIKGDEAEVVAWYESCKVYQEGLDKVLFSNTKLSTTRDHKVVEVDYIIEDTKCFVYWLDQPTNKWVPSRGFKKVEDFIILGLKLKESVKKEIGIR